MLFRYKRSGQSTPLATHLIKVASQTALGQRPKMDIFGTDYPTPDGTCIRQVIDTVKAVSGVDFHVDEGPRRAGDPAAITATGEKVRSVLGWKPAHDDLREMVSTALDWERYLLTRNR